MTTTPPTDTLPQTFHVDYDCCQCLERCVDLMTKVDAIAQAALDALGIPHDGTHEGMRRLVDRQHALVIATAELSRDALDEAMCFIRALEDYMERRGPDREPAERSPRKSSQRALPPRRK